MKVVVAPDSFKESIGAAGAAAAIVRGVRRVWPHAELVELPLADGGEGTVDVLLGAVGGELHDFEVAGPLGEPVRASFALLTGGERAAIEMSSASGLALVAPARRDPERTTTFGTGELIAAAIRAGARQVLLGIGGSATVDGGTGALAALGVRFLDETGEELAPCGGNLTRIAGIDASGIEAAVAGASIRVLCDVDNPLVGPGGAAAVFGPQKGATPEQVARLDRGLAHLAALVQRTTGRDVTGPGCGAAGGLGAGLVGLAGAELAPGLPAILDWIEFDRHLEGADLVISGEGRLDATSASGKVVSGLARRIDGRVPLLVLAGGLGDGYEKLHELGVTAAFAICPGPISLAAAMAAAAVDLERTAAEACRLLDAAPRVMKS